MKILNKEIKWIDNCREAWKLYSVKVFLVIGFMPDFYNAVASMGWLDEAPKEFVWVIRVLAAIGILMRMINQPALHPKEEEEIK